MVPDDACPVQHPVQHPGPTSGPMPSTPPRVGTRRSAGPHRGQHRRSPARWPARYRNRGIDLDDLEQVALLGLTKAAQRFDPDAGHDFLSYAVPTIRGELRRHFRDAGWMVRPPRRVQDLQARIARAQRELEAELGRSPRPARSPRTSRPDLNDVVEALSADGCFTPTSLDGTVGDGSSTLGDLIGSEDRAIESAEARVVLDPVVRLLSDRDRRIVRLRYFDERTQQEIAEDIGLTQAQVSRVLTRILGRAARAAAASRSPRPEGDDDRACWPHALHRARADRRRHGRREDRGGREGTPSRQGRRGVGRDEQDRPLPPARGGRQPGAAGPARAARRRGPGRHPTDLHRRAGHDRGRADLRGERCRPAAAEGRSGRPRHPRAYGAGAAAGAPGPRRADRPRPP